MKDHLLRFNKYPKLPDILRKIAKSKNTPFNEFLNDALLEWLMLKWNNMIEGIEYFKKLSVRKEKSEKYSSLIMLLIGIGIMGGFLTLILVSNYFLIYVLIVSLPVGYLIMYEEFIQERSDSDNIIQKIHKLGLKLVSLKLPNDLEYIIYHTAKGDFYLLQDIESLNKIKVPGNTEKIILTNHNSQYLLVFQK